MLQDEVGHLIEHYGTASEDVFKGHVTRCNPDIDLQQTKAEFNAFKHQMFMLRLV